MNEVARARLAEIAPLQQGLAAAWNTLEKHLQARKAHLVAKLIAADDEQARGRIKEIDDLLGLPERLQQEAMSLHQPQQEEAELP